MSPFAYQNDPEWRAMRRQGIIHCLEACVGAPNAERPDDFGYEDLFEDYCEFDLPNSEIARSLDDALEEEEQRRVAHEVLPILFAAYLEDNRTMPPRGYVHVKQHAQALLDVLTATSASGIVKGNAP
ncbi:MAG: hypothetical protein AAF747_08050 [Planctomycetota bacterium]